MYLELAIREIYEYILILRKRLQIPNLYLMSEINHGIFIASCLSNAWIYEIIANNVNVASQTLAKYINSKH